MVSITVPMVTVTIRMVTVTVPMVTVTVPMVSVTDSNFSHAWKDIVSKQLLFLSFPSISLDNGLATNNCYFTQDLLSL